MKKSILILALFGILSTPFAAVGSDFLSKFELQAHGGLSIPASPTFYNFFDPGISGGFSLGYKLTDQFSILVDENQGFFNAKEVPVSPTLTPINYLSTNQYVQEWALLAKYRFYSTNSNFVPFLFAGPGLVWHNVVAYYTDTGISFFAGSDTFHFYPDGEITEPDFFIDSGLGMDLCLNDNISTFIQVKAAFNLNSRKIFYRFDDNFPNVYCAIETGLTLSLGSNKPEAEKP